MITIIVRCSAVVRDAQGPTDDGDDPAGDLNARLRQHALEGPKRGALSRDRVPLLLRSVLGV
jgi:hypothetical protein